MISLIWYKLINFCETSELTKQELFVIQNFNNILYKSIVHFLDASKHEYFLERNDYLVFNMQIIIKGVLQSFEE